MFEYICIYESGAQVIHRNISYIVKEHRAHYIINGKCKFQDTENGNSSKPNFFT